jgi:hypothetical protein
MREAACVLFAASFAVSGVFLGSCTATAESPPRYRHPAAANRNRRLVLGHKTLGWKLAGYCRFRPRPVPESSHVLGFVPSGSSLKKAVAVDLAALPDSAVWIDMVKPTAAEDQSVEGLARLSNKITLMLDAMLGVVNLEHNNIIKLFSVMGVVLMPRHAGYPAFAGMTTWPEQTTPPQFLP